MKSVLGLGVGGFLAFAIACGGAGQKQASQVGAPRPDTKAEIARLDQEITAQMQQLNEPRPAPPVAACVENCREPMVTQAAHARIPEDATCKPAQTEVCVDACTLKTSICDNAARICTLASDLGGNDAFANDVCNRGIASCEASKKRCCSCM